MDPRTLAALLSSLVSQLVVVLLLTLFPSSDPLTITNSNPLSPGIPFPLLHHCLTTLEVASTLSLLSFSRKRKRTHSADSVSPDNSKPSKRARVDSAIPVNPDSYKSFFNMSSSTFEWLCGLLDPLLDCRDPIDSPLNMPAETRLGIGLFRLATGSDYSEIANRFRVSVPASRFCARQLCRVLCTNFRFWVGFPDHIELVQVSTLFESLIGLPHCCGIVKRTRFKFRTYGASDNQEECVAVQIVVDSSSKILSIVAGFRGHVSDMGILKSSTLYKDVEKGLLLNAEPVCIHNVAVPQYLVGDGEYPLLPWLIVPFLDPKSGSCEESFNNVHKTMRVSATKAVASLRNWGVLRGAIEADFKAAVTCIGACSILHNMLLSREDFSALSDELGDHSLYDGSRDDNSLKESYVDEKAFAIRNALATKAKEFSESDHPANPGN